MSAAGRADEIAANLARVRERIAAAAVAAGRDADEVTLIAVTKTYPAADAAALLDLGVTDLGESRDQEASDKTADVAAARPAHAARWHMVGRLQRNKARSVAAWASVVQSVDSPRLADALGRAAADVRDAPLDVLVQVSLDGDVERGGCPIPDVPNLAERIGSHSELRLRGVMAVAPRDADPDTAFATLRTVADALRREHPQADVVSAGMTNDLEAAIRHGSTCVRVGAALLGVRPLTSP